MVASADRTRDTRTDPRQSRMYLSNLPSASRFRVFLLICVTALAGCASQPARDLVSRTIAEVPASKIAGKHEIFVATTREPAREPRAVFGGRRSAELSYARVDISVPAIHKPAEIERPINPDVGDPARYFTALRVEGYGGDEAFLAALRDNVASHDGRALVFIHGYNTSFDNAVYRMTQIVHDAGYGGTPILFSWASAGRTLDYVYDSNSASAARDALEKTLLLVSRSGAKRIDVVAHSMGNWVTMEALRQLAITGHRDLNGKLGDVVLASPDIDVDVFKSQMRRYGKPEKPFFVMTSANDRALNVSGFIAGNRPRVGDYADAQDLARYGVTVVDLTAMSAGDRLNHTKFADNPVLVRLLGEHLSTPDDLNETESEITNRIGSLAQGLGQTLTSAAEIIITTPLEVINIAVGGGQASR
ncbi:esterase/lipase superfamily enzyme [Mesorhizobium sp. J18]|nr:esterase/lipase superfamily enzyme [Mesorhizobium sp. J18]